MNKKLLNKGFTLIEILVVIGIIAILAAIVIIAINPAKQFAQARNTQRTSDVSAISSAIGQRMADNKGVFEGNFTIAGIIYECPLLPDGVGAPANISDAMGDETVESGRLGCLEPTYIAVLPEEPIATGDAYTVELLGNGRVEVCAPTAADEDSIPDAAEVCVTR